MDMRPLDVCKMRGGGFERRTVRASEEPTEESSDEPSATATTWGVSRGVRGVCSGALIMLQEVKKKILSHGDG